MRILIIGLALAAGLYAQEKDRYIATANTTALTLQQPASNARQITFGDSNVAGASVYCASASTATISWNGTVTTATAGTEKKLPGTQQASGATIWTATNQSSAGTTGAVYNVPAGATFLIDLTWFRFGTQGTSANLTITTSNSCTITFAYSAV
jgi:hypothetical protein